MKKSILAAALLVLATGSAHAEPTSWQAANNEIAGMIIGGLLLAVAAAGIVGGILAGLHYREKTPPPDLSIFH